MSQDLERRLRRLEELVVNFMAIQLVRAERISKEHPEISIETARALLLQFEQRVTEVVREMKGEGI